LTMNSF